jgi:hypothetical protein
LDLELQKKSMKQGKGKETEEVGDNTKKGKKNKNN